MAQQRQEIEGIRTKQEGDRMGGREGGGGHHAEPTTLALVREKEEEVEKNEEGRRSGRKRGEGGVGVNEKVNISKSMSVESVDIYIN